MDMQPAESADVQKLRIDNRRLDAELRAAYLRLQTLDSILKPIATMVDLWREWDSDAIPVMERTDPRDIAGDS